jgi:hypothetical protein
MFLGLLRPPKRTSGVAAIGGESARSNLHVGHDSDELLPRGQDFALCGPHAYFLDAEPRRVFPGFTGDQKMLALAGSALGL